MILVTVGMSEHKFDRLFKLIEELCEEGLIKDDIIVQCGKKIYKSKYFKSFDIIPNDEFKDLMKKSNYLITHAGTGSVVPALKQGKKVIVFPRLEKYKEHVDNHQVELAELFKKNNYVLSAYNKDELIECIKKIDDFIPKPFISNNENMNNLIINFIDN